MQEGSAPPSRKAGFLRRLTPRQWRFVAAGAVVLIVAIVIAGIVLGRSGDKASQADVRQGLADVVTRASQEAGPGGQPLDLVKVKRDLDKAASSWVVDLAATDDRRTIGVAARQPDGPACVLLWTAVGGARSVVVDDPVLPCLGRIALAAAT